MTTMIRMNATIITKKTIAPENAPLSAVPDVLPAVPFVPAVPFPEYWAEPEDERLTLYFCSYHLTSRASSAVTAPS